MALAGVLLFAAGSSAAGAATPSPTPTPTVTVTIEGTPEPGNVLSANIVGVPASSIVGYVWFGVPQSFEPTYTVLVSDVGSTVQLDVDYRVDGTVYGARAPGVLIRSASGTESPDPDETQFDIFAVSRPEPGIYVRAIQNDSSDLTVQIRREQNGDGEYVVVASAPAPSTGDTVFFSANDGDYVVAIVDADGETLETRFVQVTGGWSIDEPDPAPSSPVEANTPPRVLPATG